MEFILMATDKATNTPEQRRGLLKVFSQWQPPEGVDMKMLYIATDERHTFGLFEAASAAAILQVTSTFGDYLEFEVFPVVPAQEGATIIGQTQAWVDEVKGV